MTLLRLPSMLLRLTWVVNLLLGITFWTGNLESLKLVHMIVGIMLVLALWWIAILAIMRQGFGVLPALALLDGLALYALGVSQEQLLPQNHWIIQVAHLLLAIFAIALGEMITARLTRAQAA